MPADRIDAVVSLAKRRGFVFPSSEIYGGTRSAWDYGPLGVELKENIRRQWWQIDGAAAATTSSASTPRSSWPARSGRPPATSTTFVDPLTECQSCHKRFRADHLEEAFEEKHGTPPANGLAEIACPNCGTKGTFTEPRMFNGLLKTYLGPVEDESGLHYLRPETAQGIFINYTNVAQLRAQEAAVRHRARSASRSATRSPRATSSSAPASSSRWRWSSSSSPAPTRSGTSTGSTSALELVRRPRHRAGQPAPLRAPEGEAVALLQAHRRHRVPVPASAARSSASSRASPTAPTST